MQAERSQNRRRYWDTTDASYPACRVCEHCDGENSSRVRNDQLRGLICPVCDDAWDRMYAELDNEEVI